MRIVKALGAAVALLMGTAGAFGQSSAPEIRIVRLREPVVLDGRSDEGAWKVPATHAQPPLPRPDLSRELRFSWGRVLVISLLRITYLFSD